jgi:hypothetical protein
VAGELVAGPELLHLIESGDLELVVNDDDGGGGGEGAMRRGSIGNSYDPEAYEDGGDDVDGGDFAERHGRDHEE